MVKKRENEKDRKDMGKWIKGKGIRWMYKGKVKGSEGNKRGEKSKLRY